MGEQKKKGSISEEDISLLLQRYSATTILALLQEIFQFAGAEIDWKTLVKKTSTGISSAREYQMLWRHLAYNITLLEKLEDDAEPLDNDSDLEFEIEAVPAVSIESSSEAAACVKVLISSGLQRDSCTLNRSTVEGPLTINVPNDQQQMARCPRGTTNITVPVSVQRQPLHTGTSGEVLDENGSGSGLLAKKKRKFWTDEEDMELLAAVQKCGEGNWANILKGNFKHDRTAAQLSQRWSTIRKREPNLHLGGPTKSNGPTRSEERLAAQHTLNSFIGMPIKGKSSSAMCSGVAQSSTLATSTLSALLPEAPSVPAPQSVGQTRNASDPSTSQKAYPNLSNKPRATLKRPVLAPSTCSNSSIQEAAFAAGGRIADPSTAASLLKAAQSKTADHNRPTVPAHLKLPVAVSKPSPATETTDFSVNPESQGRPHLRPPVMPPPPVNSGTGGPRIGSQQGKDKSAGPANFVESTQQGIKSSAIVAEVVLMKEAGAVDRMELDALPSAENTVLEGHADRDTNVLKPGAPEGKNGNVQAAVDMAVDDGGAQIPEIATGGPNVILPSYVERKKPKP